MFLVTVVFLCLASVYLYYKWAFSYWKRKGVPYVPAHIPFGSSSDLVRRKLTFGGQFKKVYEKYKNQQLPYIGFYLFTKPTLVLLDLQLIKTILTTDFHHFTDHGTYVSEENEPLTAHLFGLKGQKWKHLRAKLTPTFTSGKMKMMFNTLVDCSNGLKEVMDGISTRQEPIEIKDVVARYTTDVIGSCAFGLDCNSLKNPNSEFRRFGKNIFETNIFQGMVRFLALVSPNIVNTLHLKFLNKASSDFIMDVVRATVDYREKNNIKRDDFMHLLIQLKNNVQITDDQDIQHLKNKENPTSKDGLTIDQIAAQVFVFFIAGFETSSTTLTFCLFELVKNKEIQEKLKIEVNTVLKKYNGNITYEGLSEMTYMDKCIQETLRKYPPVPILLRECTESYIIPDTDVCVEKGTRVIIPVLGIHNDPTYYPDPDEFDPERFSAENKANRDHFAWLPFGEGPRTCIGLRFGLMQTKVALAVLIRHYDFSLSNKTILPVTFNTNSLITAVKDGIWLNVKKLE